MASWPWPRPRLFVAIGFVALGPVLAASSPPLEKALNVAYPAFDFLILIPLVILLRITVPFRGGRDLDGLGRAPRRVRGDGARRTSSTPTSSPWASPGSSRSSTSLFILAYILVAQATLKQRELLTS